MSKLVSTSPAWMRSAMTVGAFTSLSRILGFVRDIVIASAFGTGVAAEAFVISFKLPNILRDLVGEGAANSAIVPVMTELKSSQSQDYWKVANTILCYLGGILCVLSVLGILFSGAIVSITAPGFVSSTDPDKYPLAVNLTRITFPYIFLIGLSAVMMGILNSLNEFKSSAMGPVWMNICLITAGAYFERFYGVYALAYGVLAGGLLQLGWQIPALLKQGYRFHKPDWGHPSLKTIARLLVPRALGSGIYQINVITDSVLASFEKIVGSGGQSALYYSNRLFQLPLAIFGVSLAQVLLPTFSRHIALGDHKSLDQTFVRAVRWMSLFILPASFGLLILSVPIVRIIFERGRFDGYSTLVTSSALMGYSAGLYSCCMIKILVNVYYARKDTRTPVKTMGVAVLFNILCALMLMNVLKVAGLAISASLAATLNAYLLYRGLQKQNLLPSARTLRPFIVKVLGACIVMAACCYLWTFYLNNPMIWRSTIKYWMLAAAIVTSALAYIAACYALKIEEICSHMDKTRRQL